LTPKNTRPAANIELLAKSNKTNNFVFILVSPPLNSEHVSVSRQAKKQLVCQRQVEENKASVSDSFGQAPPPVVHFHHHAELS
jgi:hypothetical protein